MDKLKYKMFTWPENPEEFTIRAIRAPQYGKGPDGAGKYQGMGPLCRVIRARGVFHGSMAHSQFNALAVIMATGTVGELVHPVWGTMQAFLTELELEQESREDYVAYRISFREANETGEIPPLPDGVEPF